MRIYGTEHIPATIRRKVDLASKLAGKTRQLTEDDFEIVPEHDEEVLLEVRCELCGVLAEKFDPDGGNSSLLCIEFETATGMVTQDLLGDYYEVCEPCMRTTIVPYLNSLRRVAPPPVPEEEPALRSATEPDMRHAHIPPGTLIGDDEDQLDAASLPPITDDEPF